MATIRDVARRAKVSVGTVSNVLSGLSTVNATLRTRVDEVMRELDFHPNHSAQSLRSRRTRTLGMAIPDITNPFFPQLVRGAEEAALLHGYLLITCNSDDKPERERQVLTILRARRVDGILLVAAPGAGVGGHIQRTLEAHTPIVCLDRVAPRLALDSVSIDNVKGAQAAVRHLLQRNHKRIAFLSGTLALDNARQRLAGYRAALEEAGLTADPELVVEGDFREDSGYRLGKELLLRHNRPTAIFAANGMMALGLLHAIRETGLRCPGQIAVVSFDDLPMATALRPQLTSVAQPAFEMGYKGAELLIQRIEGTIKSAKRVRLVLEPELKIRESTSGILADS